MNKTPETIQQQAADLPADGGVYILAHDGGWAQRIPYIAVTVLPAIAVLIAADEVAAGNLKPWQIVLALVMYGASMSGITIGFHRLLTHRSFRTPPAIKALLCILGSMAAQGSAIYWVGNHRRHHRFADQAGDPHSPFWVGERQADSRFHGLWHAHLDWMSKHRLTNNNLFCKDLYQDRLILRLNRCYYLWVAMGLVVPALVGALLERSAAGAWQGLLWGGGVRLFFSSHAIYAINSISHGFGRRPFATRDRSTNNMWLAIPTLGESWHNNHHACPSSAFFGFQWWQIDVGALAIRLLEKTRLASNVVRPDETILSKLRVTRTERRKA